MLGLVDRNIVQKVIKEHGIDIHHNGINTSPRGDMVHASSRCRILAGYQQWTEECYRQSKPFGYRKGSL